MQERKPSFAKKSIRRLSRIFFFVSKVFFLHYNTTVRCIFKDGRFNSTNTFLLIVISAGDQCHNAQPT